MVHLNNAKESLTKLKNGIQDWADPISKTAAFLAALAYVVGLVVINISLEHYGYSSFKMFRVDYVRAGFWAVGSAGLVVFISYILLRVCRVGDRGTIENSIVIVFVLGAALLLYSGLLPQPSFVEPAVFDFIVLCSLASAILVLRDLHLIRFVLSGVIVSVAVLLFSVSMYNHVSTALAGGELKKVRLLYNSNEEALFSAAGVNPARTITTRSGDTVYVSRALSLIDESDQSLIITVLDSAQRRHTAAIKKDLVQGIIYINREGVK